MHKNIFIIKILFLKNQQLRLVCNYLSGLLIVFQVVANKSMYVLVGIFMQIHYLQSTNSQWCITTDVTTKRQIFPNADSTILDSTGCYVVIEANNTLYALASVYESSN